MSHTTDQRVPYTINGIVHSINSLKLFLAALKRQHELDKRSPRDSVRIDFESLENFCEDIKHRFEEEACPNLEKFIAIHGLQLSSMPHQIKLSSEINITGIPRDIAYLRERAEKFLVAHQLEVGKVPTVNLMSSPISDSAPTVIEILEVENKALTARLQTLNESTQAITQVAMAKDSSQVIASPSATSNSTVIVSMSSSSAQLSASPYTPETKSELALTMPQPIVNINDQYALLTRLQQLEEEQKQLWLRLIVKYWWEKQESGILDDKVTWLLHRQQSHCNRATLIRASGLIAFGIAGILIGLYVRAPVDLDIRTDIDASGGYEEQLKDLAHDAVVLQQNSYYLDAMSKYAAVMAGTFLGVAADYFIFHPLGEYLQNVKQRQQLSHVETMCVLYDFASVLCPDPNRQNWDPYEPYHFVAQSLGKNAVPMFKSFATRMDVAKAIIADTMGDPSDETTQRPRLAAQYCLAALHGAPSIPTLLLKKFHSPLTSKWVEEHQLDARRKHNGNFPAIPAPSDKQGVGTDVRTALRPYFSEDKYSPDFYADFIGSIATQPLPMRREASFMLLCEIMSYLPAATLQETLLTSMDPEDEENLLKFITNIFENFNSLPTVAKQYWLSKSLATVVQPNMWYSGKWASLIRQDNSYKRFADIRSYFEQVFPGGFSHGANIPLLAAPVSPNRSKMRMDEIRSALTLFFDDIHESLRLRVIKPEEHNYRVAQLMIALALFADANVAKTWLHHARVAYADFLELQHINQQVISLRHCQFLDAVIFPIAKQYCTADDNELLRARLNNAYQADRQAVALDQAVPQVVVAALEQQPHQNLVVQEIKTNKPSERTPLLL